MKTETFRPFNIETCSIASFPRRRCLIKTAAGALLALAVLLAAGRVRAQEPGSGGITDAEIRDVVVRVARHQLHPLKDGEYPAVKSAAEARAANPPEGLTWSYQWGITLNGLRRAAELTGDKEVEKFALDHNLICARYYHWLAGLGKAGVNDATMRNLAARGNVEGMVDLGELDNLDNCGGMGDQLLEIIARHPDQATPEEKELAAHVADRILLQQARRPDHVIWRPQRLDGTIWPDDLYLACPLLIRWGQSTGDKKYLDDAATQIIHQAPLQQDRDGLWFHGYFVNDKTHGPFKWGRGNGWAAMALVEVLSALPEDHPDRAPLLNVLRRQIDGLGTVQAPDGMWRRILNNPELQEETSCTAMFAYAIARAANRGWIDATNMTMARHAFAGIAKNVTTEGVVKGACENTAMSMDLGYYLSRQQPDDEPHGRGATLLAGTEILAARRK